MVIYIEDSKKDEKLAITIITFINIYARYIYIYYIINIIIPFFRNKNLSIL